ncbi:hypothetical protein KBD45_00450 [Candidatus Dojkabacteria bacterium]|nr:hypothetical protein [Candidatus Dojkabacteria bacterium]
MKIKKELGLKILLVSLLLTILVFLLIDISKVIDNRGKVEEGEFIMIYSDTGKIRVMNWNIGPIYVGTGIPKTEEETQQMINQQIARMQKLAQVIKDNQVDVVFLQQFTNVDPRPNRKVKIKQFDVLLQKLKEIEWEMYGDVEAYSGKIPPGEDHLVILSRFALDVSSRKITRDIHKVNSRVAQTIMTKKTPIGDVRLSNFHTHIDDPCTNFIKALTFFEQFDYERTILGGDANITFSNFYGQPENLARPDCKGYDWTKFSNECSEYPYNCEPKDAKCRNSSKCFGDYFYLPNPSELKILTSWTIGNAHNISDQHPAVVAEIGSKVPLELASPTATLSPISTPTLIPSITPTPGVTIEATPIPTAQVTPEDKHAIDLNGDSQVDIADFALFVEYYKAGNVKIDYDNDGKTQRDIDDFTYFVRYYKAETQ